MMQLSELRFLGFMDDRILKVCLILKSVNPLNPNSDKRKMK